MIRNVGSAPTTHLRKVLAQGRQWAVMAACSALVGCAVLSSETFETLSKDGVQPVGVQYALPMGVLDVTLFVNEEVAEYRIGLLEHFVPDPARRYVLRYHPAPNYEDTIEVKVSNRSLLQEINSTTEDKTDEIVVEIAKLARSLGRFQAAAAPANFIKLANITIDPTDPDVVAKAGVFLSGRARSFAQSKFNLACRGATAKTLVCGRYKRYSQRDDRLIELAVDHPAAVLVTTGTANCTSGLCYRVKEPYMLTYTMDGVRRAKVLELPNKAPVIEIDITRAFLVKKIQTITFDGNGFLKSAYVKKPSELQAAASLPIQVISAINEALPLRLNIQNQQIDLAEKKLADLDAREALNEARSKQNETNVKEPD